MASAQELSPHGGEYRQFLPDLSIPRFTIMQQQDAHVYAEAFKKGGVPPWLHALYLHWLEMVKEPFKGVTNDGTFPTSRTPRQYNTRLTPDKAMFAQDSSGSRTRGFPSAASLRLPMPSWPSWTRNNCHV